MHPYGKAGVEKSPALRLDFKQPFIIGNDDLTTLDGFEGGEPNLLFNCSDCRTFFGVTAKGQLYYSMQGVSRGVVRKFTPLDIPPNNSVVISYRLGEVLEVTSRITYPELSPQEQWRTPLEYFYNAWMVKPKLLIPPYPILPILELVGWDAATEMTINKLFAPTTSP